MVHPGLQRMYLFGVAPSCFNVITKNKKINIFLFHSFNNFQVLDVPRSKAKPAWIFFDTNNALLELFRNTHIWFDWEVIITNDTTTNQIDLFEVYHVAYNKSLHVDCFATWNSVQGLKLNRVSLVQRRNNLQKQVINAGSIHYPVSYNFFNLENLLF